MRNSYTKEDIIYFGPGLCASEGCSIKYNVFPALTHRFVCLIIILIPVFATVVALVLINSLGFRNIVPLVGVIGLVLAQYLALGAYIWIRAHAS